MTDTLKKCAKCGITAGKKWVGGHLLASEYDEPVCYTCAYKDFKAGKIKNPQEGVPVKLDW